MILWSRGRHGWIGREVRAEGLLRVLGFGGRADALAYRGRMGLWAWVLTWCASAQGRGGRWRTTPDQKHYPSGRGHFSGIQSCTRERSASSRGTIMNSRPSPVLLLGLGIRIAAD